MDGTRKIKINRWQYEFFLFIIVFFSFPIILSISSFIVELIEEDAEKKKKRSVDFFSVSHKK
jgi:hypothetical protein